MNTAAIILAAGKGTRLNSTTINKVMLPLGCKPMVAHTVETLEELGVEPIVMVVGYLKETVIEYFGDRVVYAEQENQLGTGHAAACGLTAIPEEVEDILLVYGDDSYAYDTDILQKLLAYHRTENVDATLMTIEKEDPAGLGRIKRDPQGKLEAIIEEKNASSEEKRITEVNPGCYVFKRSFLEKFFPRIEKNSVSEEYYLTDIIGLGLTAGREISTLRAGELNWRGVNTPEELEQAEILVTRGQG